jgi:predicted nucleotidyltransferase component of viral defense system
MSRVSQMLKRWAHAHGNPPFWVVEKDYALSYLLAGIASVDSLRDGLLLKGGGALKKAYFANYRFSEDLDYTVRAGASLYNIDALIQTAADVCQELLQEQGAFSVQSERLILRLPHPGGQDAFTVRIQFPGQREALCRLKVEITRDELVLWSPMQRSLLHGFPESLTLNLTCYSLEEIVAEKLRALLQSRLRLSQRGWGADRVCRDYYDLWHVLCEREIQRADFGDRLSRKCAYRGVTFQSALDFFDPALINVAQREWSRQLTPFVRDCPDVASVLDELESLVSRLLGWVA